MADAFATPPHARATCRARPRRFLAPIAGCVVALLAAPALAQDAGCGKLAEQRVRAACAAAAASSRPSARSAMARVSTVVPTRPAAVPTIDARDLGRGDLDGRRVLVERARCAYLDVHAYRCTTRGEHAIEIEAAVVTPPWVQFEIEAGCGSPAGRSRNACEHALSFVPQAVERTAGGRGGPAFVVRTVEVRAAPRGRRRGGAASAR